MGRLAGFGYSEIAHRLRMFGFEVDRRARGSHEIWYNPLTHKRTVVPYHGGDMPEGTLDAILKRAGISASEFLNAK